MKYFINFLPFDDFKELKLNRRTKNAINEIEENPDNFFVGDYNNFADLILYLQEHELYDYNKMFKINQKHKGYSVCFFSLKEKRNKIKQAYVLVYKD